MQELVETWWYGYVLIPICIALLFGSVLGVVTGLVLARLTAFDQARMRACSTLARLMDMVDCESLRAAEKLRDEVASEFIMLQGEFIRLRQSMAASHMRYIAARLKVSPWENPDGNCFPLNGDVRDLFAQRLAFEISVFAKMCFDQRPGIYPLVTLRGYVSSHESMDCIPPQHHMNYEASARSHIDVQRRKAEQERQKRDD